jgi:hypothetical protein
MTERLILADTLSGRIIEPGNPCSGAPTRERLIRGGGLAEIVLLSLVGFALLVAALIAVLQMRRNS